MTGYSVKELNVLGGIVKLPNNAELEKLKELVENLFNGHKVIGDPKIKSKKGQLFTVQFVAWPLFDEEGHVIGSLTAARQTRDGHKVNSSPQR